MKHIKQDFSPKAWVQPHGVDLGGRAKAKNKLLWNMVMLHIKLKLMMQAATFAHRHTLDLQGGVRRSNHFF